MSYNCRVKILFAILFYLFYAANISSAEDPSRTLIVEENYTIKEGDTLWDISSQFLNDPFKWQKIWRLNPFITNPDLIFPGEILTLKPVKRPAPLPVEEVKEEVEIVVEEEIEEVKPEPPRVSLSSLGQKRGVISKEGVKGVGIILASREGNILIREGDDVYVRMNDEKVVQYNERFSIFDDMGEIIHPLSGDIWGHRIEIIGEVKIIKKENDIYRAKIVASYREIIKGARIMPYREPLRDVVIKEGEVPVEGIILASLDGRVTISERDIVFIDKGDKDGLERGNLLTIYKKGKKVTDPLSEEAISLPLMDIGSLVIIDTQDTVSTAMVIASKKAIYKGDIVRSCEECISDK